MNALQTGGIRIAFDQRNENLIFSRLWKVNPAHREFLIVMRGVLLVLDVLTTLNVDPPNQAAFTAIGQADVVIAGFGNNDVENCFSTL